MKAIILLLVLFSLGQLKAEELENILTEIKEKYKLPSVAAVVSKDGKIIAK